MTGKTKALLRKLAEQAGKNARRAVNTDQARKHRKLARYLRRRTDG